MTRKELRENYVIFCNGSRFTAYFVAISSNCLARMTCPSELASLLLRLQATLYKYKFHSLTNSTASAIYGIVKNVTGHPPVAQWFKREKQNSMSMHGIRIPDKLAGRKISNEQFPLLLINTDKINGDEKILLSEYIKWQAPYLLTLQTLDDETRSYLE